MADQQQQQQPPPEPSSSSTPLDVLLTAISGSTVNYPYPPQPPSALNFDQAKVSTVQLWYPTTAQKSYGKEKRMLNPPPSLRVHGPLSDSLTTVTLVAKSALPSNTTDTPNIACSQTHRIPLQPASDDAEHSEPLRKKAKGNTAHRRLLEQAAEAGLGASLPWNRHKRIARARGALSDGLLFPGIWAGEGLEKAKQFELELQIGQPGVEAVDIVAPADEDAGPSSTAIEVPLDDPPSLQSEANPPTVIDATDSSTLDSSFPPGLTAADLENIGGSSSDFMTTLEQHLNHSALADHVEEQECITILPGGDTQPTELPEPSEVVPTEQTPPVSGETAKIPNRRPHRSLAYKNLPRAITDPSPWATFPSSPIAIVSKPSIRTAKARTMASCLTSNDTFALYVRVNSQATRTKYMKLEEGELPQMTARTGQWSPFRFEIIRREPIANKTDADMERLRQLGPRYEHVLTYGSIVVLVDANTGVKSEPVRLTKVERNIAVVDNDTGHPISELHRVGFVRETSTDNPGTLEARTYLSAPGARLDDSASDSVKTDQATPLARGIADPASSSAIDGPQTLGDISASGSVDNIDPSLSSDPPSNSKMKKRKTPRTALAKAAIAESEDISTAALAWHMSVRGVQEIEEGLGKKVERRMATVETVEDWMCWTIVSVDSLSYSFFDWTPNSPEIPAEPMRSIPRVLVEPKYQPKHNMVDLVIAPLTNGPFDLYIGTQGPLPISLWKSSASSDMSKSGIEAPALLLDDKGSKSLSRQVTSSFPSLIPHVLIVLELPKAEDIRRLSEATRSNTGNETETGVPLLVPDQAEEPLPSAMDDTSLNNVDAVWDGKLDLEIGNAFDHPDMTFGQVSSTMIGAGEVGAALEALSAVPERTGDVEVGLKALPVDERAVDGRDTALILKRPVGEGTQQHSLPLYLMSRADGVTFGLGYTVDVGVEGDIRISRQR